MPTYSEALALVTFRGGGSWLTGLWFAGCFTSSPHHFLEARRCWSVPRGPRVAADGRRPRLPADVPRRGARHHQVLHDEAPHCDGERPAVPDVHRRPVNTTAL